MTWGFTDRHSWVPGELPGFGDALPFDAEYRAKPARAALRRGLAQGRGEPQSGSRLTSDTGVMMIPTMPPPCTAHPLAMVTGEEITPGGRAHPRPPGRLTDAARFAHVVLHEPAKDVARAVEAGRPGRPASCGRSSSPAPSC